MTVITMTNCPQKLRGDLSKWLMEINTGVYVGNVSARVREALWKRITESIRNGQATMVYSANNEQGMLFRVHNTTWTPVDFDGFTLMRRPNAVQRMQQDAPAFSYAELREKGKRKRRDKPLIPENCLILDIETTGLSPFKDDIMEIGILVIQNGQLASERKWLVQSDKPIPPDIQEMTGITNDLCKEEGENISDILSEVYDILNGKEVIGYHASFDAAFLEAAFERNHFALPSFHMSDAEMAAKRLLPHLPDYKMQTVASHLGIAKTQQHRALADCRLLYGILLKLNEINQTVIAK